MSWNDNIGAVLSPSTTGLTIGYKIENVDGTEYASFTTVNVVESTEVAGSWHTTAAVALPGAGGRIYWGESGGDYLAWTLIPPAPATSAEIAALNDLSSAEAQSAAAAALATYDGPTNAEMLASFAALNDVTAAEIAAALAGTKTITVLSTVNAGAVTVYRGDTWSFTISISGLTLTDYEAVAFVVKADVSDTDAAAILYVRDDVGLVYVSGSSSPSASNGSLTVDSDTQVTVLIAKDETAGVTRTTEACWYLVGFDTTPTPNQKMHRATGTFAVLPYGLQATA